MKRAAFLSAEWRHLIMANYVIDPAILKPLVPFGTELDDFDGQVYVSMVGFRFLDTRVKGIPIPGHRNFEEVNLRFYVRRKVEGEWRRGVVFVSEIVPRWAIAFVARTLYGEPYLALPMQHVISESGPLQVRYNWKHSGRWNTLEASASGGLEPMAPGSVEEFISEHYWGYTARGKSSAEYEVEHPRWNIWKTSSARLDCDVAKLYGAPFVESLAANPASAFIAEGSAVTVRAGATVR